MNPLLSVAYYPSMVAHFTLRFDENFQVTVTDAPAAEERQSAIDPLSRAVGIGNTTNPGARSAAQTRGSAVVPQETPQRSIQPLLVEGDDTHVLNVIPRSASVELPGVRQAAKFSLSFDFRDIPIDPRLVRAAGIEIHMGLVPPDAFGRGMLGERENGRRVSQLNTRASGISGILGSFNQETFLLAGVVDTWSVDHGPSGSVVTVEGRDTRAILLDGRLPIEAIDTLDMSQTIDNVVAQILQLIPTELGFSLPVVANAADFGGAIPSPASLGSLTRVRQGARGNKAKSMPANIEKMSYWDLITKLCFLVGAVPHVYGRELRIQPSRGLYEQIRGTGGTTPFRGGEVRRVTVQDGSGQPRVDPLSVRRLIYGRDVQTLAFERKYGSTAVPTVAVIGTDDTVRGPNKRVEVRWPPGESKADAFAAGADPLFFPVPGVRDRARLEVIARDLYEEIGHGEMGGSCTTKKLSSFGGDASDPDLLTLRPSDAVEFLVDVRALSSRAPLVSELAEQGRRSFAEQVEHVKSRLSLDPEQADENLARVLVATSRSAAVRGINFFRVANVKYDWELGSGIGLSFDFQSYVEVAHRQPYTQETQMPEAPQVSTVQRAGVPRGQVAPGVQTDEGGKNEATQTRVRGIDDLRGALKGAGMDATAISAAVDSVFGGRK